MKKIVLVVLVAVFQVTGCESDKTSDPELSGRPGADRDEHGCIGSAGYTWCERTEQCERPWELAKQAGFDNTGEGFKAYCDVASGDAQNTQAPE